MEQLKAVQIGGGRHLPCVYRVTFSWSLHLRERRPMSDQIKLPPIIEPWRILAIILAVATAMMFVHSVTPTHAEAVHDRPTALQTP